MGNLEAYSTCRFLSTRFQEKESNSSGGYCPWTMLYLLTCRSPRTWDNQIQFPWFEKYTDISGLLEVVVTHQHVLRCFLSSCPFEDVALYME